MQRDYISGRLDHVCRWPRPRDLRQTPDILEPGQTPLGHLDVPKKSPRYDTEWMIESQPSGVGRTWNRIDGIDLLRGLSIVFVLMNHVNIRLLGAEAPDTKALPAQLIYTLVWNGQFAVQMFFSISGYLIASTSIRRWKGPEVLKIETFYLLRFARIAPLMILLLIILSGLHLAHVLGYVVSQYPTWRVHG